MVTIKLDALMAYKQTLMDNQQNIIKFHGIAKWYQVELMIRSVFNVLIEFYGVSSKHLDHKMISARGQFDITLTLDQVKLINEVLGNL